ncbi:hypothetical protein HOLleu_12828 [Holothuria leucospilota]|uniref:Nitrate/nitrite sensing protein domain-containing protein n=1 Tax=Holothuria leucospilota TaxID=206669 RepID=A0A9Q1CBZ8_HOLLE|nr:hypothetical protein HOLleu_12828 [Holothuria leucospilota]
MKLKRNTISPVPNVIIDHHNSKENIKASFHDTESVISGYSAGKTALFLADAGEASSRKDFAKVLLLLALPLLTILILSCITIVRTINIVSIAEETRNAVDINEVTTDLVAALQIERGMSTGLLGSHNDTDVLKQVQYLAVARERTNYKILQLLDVSDFVFPELPIGNTTVTSTSELQILLQEHRKIVDASQVIPEENVHFYTNINVGLIKTGFRLSTNLDGGDLWPLFVARDLLLQVTDLFGIARALGAQYYTSCQLDEDTKEWFSSVKSQGQQLLEVAFAYDSNLEMQYIESAIEKTVNESILKEKEHEILKNEDACVGLTPMQKSSNAFMWFDNMSKKIESIILTRTKLAALIVTEVSRASSSAKWTTSICVVALVLTVTICLFSGAWYAKESYNSIHKLGKFFG